MSGETGNCLYGDDVLKWQTIIIWTDLCEVINNGDSTEINFAKLVSPIKTTMPN